ncbi:MAG: hypothetical protein U1E65_23230 [Myxococcota bacterium]
MSDAPKPTIDLERAALGEADASAFTEAERAAVEALRAENAQFLAEHPPGPALAEIRRRAAVTPPATPSRVPYVLAPALVAAFSVLLWVGPKLIGGPAGLESTRAKGTAQLLIHRATELGAEKLKNGESARRGDRLQLGYGSGGDGYGVILSIDGNGEVNIHLPKDSASEAAHLDPKGEALPFSYELDAAPRFERFFLVTSATSFAVAPIAQAVRALKDPERDPLALSPELSTASLLLRKVER